MCPLFKGDFNTSGKLVRFLAEVIPRRWRSFFFFWLLQDNRTTKVTGFRLLVTQSASMDINISITTRINTTRDTSHRAADCSIRNNRQKEPDDQRL
jgi:hypothetical protein